MQITKSVDIKRSITLSVLIFNFQTVFADHASISFENGASGAIMTTSGTTLPAGKTVLGIGAQFVQLESISDARLEQLGAAEQEVHSVDSLLQLSINLSYGLTDAFSIGLSLPYVERKDVREAEHDMGSGEVEVAGNAKGIGDLTLFGMYNFWHDESNDAALLVGVKTPTGKTTEKELAGVLFEVEQQPSSGSWDPFLGLAYDRRWDKTGVSANILYTFVTEGQQQTELGDIFNYNIALSHRFFMPAGGHEHTHHAHGLGIVDYVDGILELNGDVRQHEKINNMQDAHSGGHILFVSPGLRVGLGHRWSVYASVGIPVFNDLNGQQSKTDYRLVGGISASF